MIWLRPYLLLLLLLWLPLAYRLIRNGRHQSAWQRLIDPTLYAALAGQVSARRRMRSWLVPILGVLIILALAGPVQPTNSAQSVTQGIDGRHRSATQPSDPSQADDRRLGRQWPVR